VLVLLFKFNKRFRYFGKEKKIFSHAKQNSLDN